MNKIKSFKNCKILQQNFDNLNDEDMSKVIDMSDMANNSSHLLEFAMYINNLISTEVMKYTKQLDIYDYDSDEFYICLSSILLKHLPYWTNEKANEVVANSKKLGNLDIYTIYSDLLEVNEYFYVPYDDDNEYKTDLDWFIENCIDGYDSFEDWVECNCI